MGTAQEELRSSAYPPRPLSKLNTCTTRPATVQTEVEATIDDIKKYFCPVQKDMPLKV